MKKNQKLTKQDILNRIDEIQVLGDGDRLHALLTLRDQYPEMWERLGEIFRAESGEQVKAA